VCRFATTFDLPDPDAAVALRADLRFVAGAVAWVNGAERFRTNVPAGGEGLRRPAGEEETPYWIRRTYDGRLHRSFAGLDPGGLRVRGNVVAVQVHGTAGGGDDSLRFDMRLGVHRTRALETAPYLQPLPPDGAIVRFDTSGPAVARVRYGTGLEPDREAIATEGACAASHTARLGPIDPGVEVGYRVEWCACGAERGFSDAASCGASASYRFRSAPGPGESFVVAAYGDSRGYPARHRRVIEAMLPEALAAGASLLVHTGDVTDHGHPAQEWIDQFFGPAAEMLARMPAIAVLGNHDQLAEDWHERFDFPGNGSWFRLRFGDAEFFALNAYARLYRSGSEQLAWLDEALGSSDAPWKIVVTHQPLSTCMGDAERRRESRLARSVLGPILSRHGVRLLLAGHDHLYGRSRETDGFTMVVTGGGGAGTYPVRADADMAVCESIHHFVILRVSPQAIEGRAVRVDGTLLDEFRIDR
jgi:acid phosphatase